MTLGEHPVTKALLEDLMQKRKGQFCAVALKRGVQSYDVDDVVYQAYYQVWKLDTVGDIAVQLGLSKKPTAIANVGAKPKHSLSDALAALWMKNLKYKCGEYHKTRKRERSRFISLESLPADNPLTLPASQRIGEVVKTIGPLPGVVIEKVEEGDPEMLLKFIELIAERAKLTKVEASFIKFRAHQPEARDQDFDPTLPPHTISRIKRSAFDKIREFLELPRH
jgi:hypothetical protein